MKESVGSHNSATTRSITMPSAVSIFVLSFVSLSLAVANSVSGGGEAQNNIAYDVASLSHLDR